MEQTLVKGIIRPCCSLNNLVTQKESTADMIVKRCKVCGRNHYTMKNIPAGLEVKDGKG